ncbi:hypothetical protein V8Z80_19360 [Orrella sp. JC864]|uniref:class I SAM-dependent methyltransferase n=1 Tax=Orrella sp. JC864 TaxID=3120298 RepID=UPI00300AA828
MPLKTWPDMAEACLATPIGLRLQRWRARLVDPLARRLAGQGWIGEYWRFYQAWRADPKGIGAVLPSSPALAAAITRDIGAATGPVIELGSGTGVFTRALRARGVPEETLALVEMDAGFAQRLRRDFPHAQVCCLDAARLAGDPLFYGRGAGAVVCGLPLLNMPLRQQVGILRGAFSQLRAGGAFYLFTYGPRCPVPRRVLDRLGLRATKRQTVMLNVPPAHVWKLTRRRTARNVL